MLRISAAFPAIYLEFSDEYAPCEEESPSPFFCRSLPEAGWLQRNVTPPLPTFPRWTLGKHVHPANDTNKQEPPRLPIAGRRHCCG